MEESVSTQKQGKDGDSPTKDKLFDPSVELLLNDFDDERTLEEEEALAAGESQDPDAELSNLQKESNMPLEELLALYGYQGENQENESPEEEGNEEAESTEMSETVERESEPSPQEEPSKLHILYGPIPDNDQDASRLLRSVSRVSEEEEEDYDYSPDEDEWRKVNKTIMVGSDYQAQIPDGLCHYDDALPYENEDKLLWNPSEMYGDIVEEFLKKASAITKPPLPMGTQLRDDEQALYLLQQCGHNSEEALRRLRMTLPNSATDNMNESLWSEEECRNFESGVRCFGKNFHLIQQNKIMGPALLTVLSVKQCKKYEQGDFTLKFRYHMYNKTIQLFDANISIPFDIDESLKGSVKCSRLDKKQSVFALEEKDLCHTLPKYVGDFFYDMEKKAKMPVGICPIKRVRFCI
ncbi:unnamed protein product [Acanthoscelides obtectus]|uniref:ELM2 domain-containing protein n=1 Tax=Acanthoscelides obtectus TaxID=200917 RepID=A0A9P0K0S8_ACAOB|nr:unnamed protein product [Acanthoscelides obtectus]CAK1629063.1 Mesoderm induction early response protein 1 [Acanthoscelides obtectus]